MFNASEQRIIEQGIEMELACKLFGNQSQLAHLPTDILCFLEQNDLPLCCTLPWLRTWTQHYLRTDDKLFFHVHYYQKQVVAVYPLYLKRIWFGFELRFIGTGEPEADEVCSEFQDFIISPNFQQKSLKLFTEILEKTNQISRIVLNNVLPSSWCSQWLKQNLKSWPIRSKVIGHHYRISVLDTEKAQIQALRQSSLRRQSRRFLEQQQLQVEFCCEAKHLSDYLSGLKELHQSLWQSRNKPGVFASRTFERFHQKLASIMLKQGRLLLFKITSQNECLAVFYGFYHQNTLYYYQSGIRKDADIKNVGVGMHLFAMQFAREKKIAWYDLMKGSDKSYKSAYTSPSEDIYQLIRQPNWRSYLYSISRFIKQRVQLKL